MASNGNSTKGSQSALRAFFVSGIGTALEFYDFVIYGTAAALVFPKVFFPQMDPLTATLFAFGAFGAGFLPVRWAVWCSGTTVTGSVGRKCW